MSIHTIIFVLFTFLGLVEGLVVGICEAIESIEGAAQVGMK